MPELPGPPSEPERKQRGLLAEALSAGALFPASILAGFLVGKGFDRLFGTDPIGLVVGVLLGFAAALVPLFRLSAAWDRSERGGNRTDSSDSKRSDR
jgi:ATP synthase protein I